MSKKTKTNSSKVKKSNYQIIADDFKKSQKLLKNELTGNAPPTDTASATPSTRSLIALEELDKSEQKRKSILEQGRKKGANANKLNAKSRKEELRGAAKYHFTNNPNLTYKKCVYKLKSDPITKKYTLYNKGKIYSDSHILKLISGTKEEALSN